MNVMQKETWFSLIDYVTDHLEQLPLEHIWYYRGIGIGYERKWRFYSSSCSYEIIYVLQFNAETNTFSYSYHYPSKNSRNLLDSRKPNHEETQQEIQDVLEHLLSFVKQSITQQKELRLLHILDPFQFEKLESC